jgi:AmpE protein
MAFLAVLLALAAAQLLGRHPLDVRQVRQFARNNNTWFWSVLWVLVPTLLVGFIYYWLEAHLWLLALPFAACVLWLCMGGTLTARAVESFINAGRAEHWQAALEAYRQLDGEETVTEGDWQGLNRAMLQRTAYLSFSHLFAALFWFSLLGPAGALGYRLACLSVHNQAWPAMNRFVWYLDWPVVRLLGLTFAFTGNFLVFLQRWRVCVFCIKRSTADIITLYVLGALGADEGLQQNADVTRREVTAMARLMRRSLWFWVGVLAVVALRGG